MTVAPGLGAARSRTAVAALLAVGVVVGGLSVAAESTPPAATAVPRGESLRLPGGIVISNFALPDGRRGYCVEVHLGEPTGELIPYGPVSSLPGRAGMFSSYEDPNGMRSMNYLIDTHGQTRDPWVAATVQLTIWRIREGFRPGNVELDRKLAALAQSAEGRALIAESDGLAALARREAIAPVPPEPVTGVLSWEPVGTDFLLHYPAGTDSLGVTGGLFTVNAQAGVQVGRGEAGSVRVHPDSGARELVATGRWSRPGRTGWRAELTLHDTRTASGAVGQRLAIGTGLAVPAAGTGEYTAATRRVPPPEAEPAVRSEAQRTARAMGSMEDVLVVEARPGTAARMWPEAEAEFTAYLLPEAGAPKYGMGWLPLRRDGTSVTAPSDAGGAGSGEAFEWLVWTEEEIAAMGQEERCLTQPVARVAHVPIPGPGRFTSGELPVHDSGTINWVERVTSLGEVVHEGECGLLNEATSVGRPTLDTRAPASASVGAWIRDTAVIGGDVPAEAGYSVAFEAYGSAAGGTSDAAADCSPERRVLSSPRVRIAGPGEIRSPELLVRWEHGPEIRWVAVLYAAGPGGVREVARGECGDPNETTRVDRPEVRTRAPREAAVGELVRDTALVVGELAEHASARWELDFAGYRARQVGDDGPGCSPRDLLFDTPPQGVNGAGEFASPAVAVDRSWVGDVWWQARLWLVEGGKRILAYQGQCGDPLETTRIMPPVLTTEADAIAYIGGTMTDLASIGGKLPAGEEGGLEIVFRGYRGADRVEGVERGEVRCDADSLLFETDAVPVTGHGKYRSPEVRVLPEFGSTVHWVAALRLVAEDGNREVARGTCGEQGETTSVLAPRLDTSASGEVRVGERLFDRATIEGIIPERPDGEFRVVFDAFRAGPGNTMDCAPEDRIPELSDADGVRVTRPGEYRSRASVAGPEHLGAGGYVATLVLRLDGTDHVVERGTCGDPSEAFAVRPGRGPLPATGSDVAAGEVAIQVGLALLAAGAAIMLARLHRGTRKSPTE